VIRWGQKDFSAAFRCVAAASAASPAMSRMAHLGVFDGFVQVLDAGFQMGIGFSAWAASAWVLDALACSPTAAASPFLPLSAAAMACLVASAL
jgi:hypothetical protein